jgi:hypothetical protein
LVAVERLIDWEPPSILILIFLAVWECHPEFFDPVSSGSIFPELAECFLGPD